MKLHGYDNITDSNPTSIYYHLSIECSPGPWYPIVAAITQTKEETVVAPDPGTLLLFHVHSFLAENIMLIFTVILQHFSFAALFPD